jgi:hypothetical protein
VVVPGVVFRRRAKRLALGCPIVALGSSAEGQYFGRNKVRYRTFDFQVLKTEHSDIYFYSSERKGVDVAARLAERWYARLEHLFSHTLSGRQPSDAMRRDRLPSIHDQFGFNLIPGW